MNTLGKRTLVIYADTKTDTDLLPEIVRKALYSPDSGRFIPKTVIVDPDISEVVALIPYSGEESERNKLFGEALKKLSKGMKEWKKRSRQKKPDAAKDSDK